MHYQFKVSMDRVDSASNSDFLPGEIDWLLNEAQDIFIEQRYSKFSNPKKNGFEETQKRIDDLSTLVINFPLQPALTPVLSNGVYTLDLSTLAFDYLHLISLSCVTTKDNCTFDTPMKFMPHDKITIALRDPFNSPSSDAVLYNLARNANNTTSLYIYAGDYTVSAVKVEYLKKPSRISVGNYKYIDGVIYPPATSELPSAVHREIVDIACQIAAGNIAVPQYVELKNQKVFYNE